MSNDCVDGIDSQDKWVVSVILALVASLIYSPFFFSILNAFTASFGVRTASASGCPNFAGLIIVTILYFLIVRLVLL